MKTNNTEWEKSGLLQDISEDRKEMITNCFNIAVDWINDIKIADDGERIGEIEVLIFPLFYRIAKEVDLDKIQILEVCKEFRHAWYRADMSRYPKSIDPEAAFLKAFAEMKINQCENNNKLQF